MTIFRSENDYLLNTRGNFGYGQMERSYPVSPHVLTEVKDRKVIDVLMKVSRLILMTVSVMIGT